MDSRERESMYAREKGRKLKSAKIREGECVCVRIRKKTREREIPCQWKRKEEKNAARMYDWENGGLSKEEEEERKCGCKWKKKTCLSEWGRWEVGAKNPKYWKTSSLKKIVIIFQRSTPCQTTKKQIAYPIKIPASTSWLGFEFREAKLESLLLIRIDFVHPYQFFSYPIRKSFLSQREFP